MPRPQFKPVEPSPRHLHAEVVHDLSRPIAGAPGGGVFTTLLLAVPTFGVLPMLLWPFRWAIYVSIERDQYMALAEWVRLHTRHPASARLVARADALRPNPLLSLLTGGGALGFIVLFMASLGGAYDLSLLASTYQFVRFEAGDVSFEQAMRHRVFLGWTALLAVAGFAHWLQVQLHARRVRRFLDVFNQIALDEALAPVYLPQLGVGVRPLWSLAAVGLILINALWGLPLMLAGAVQRRYTCRAGPTARAALAGRTRDLLAYGNRRYAPMPMPPALPVPPVVPARIRCATPGCRLPLPAAARFCPRCGTRAVAPLDRVA